MSALYDKVAALDKGIADRWKARTHDNPAHKLTASDVDAVVSPLFKDMKKPGALISEKQAEAIVTLVQATDFAKGGLDRLRFWVQLAEDSLALELKPLVTADELAPIHDNIVLNCRFSFTSPGTNLSYAPHHYIGVTELIKQNKILVFQAEISDLWVLTKDEGEYRSDANMLIVYDKLSNAAFASTLIHESTHAIQDWLDKKSQRRFSEADAYIAGSATMKDRMLQGDLAEKAFLASRIVIDGTAVARNKDWLSAYNKVVQAYDAEHSDGKDIDTRDEKGETENAQYQVILDAIDKQSQEFQAWVVDTVGGGVSNLEEGVRKSLP